MELERLQLIECIVVVIPHVLSLPEILKASPLELYFQSFGHFISNKCCLWARDKGLVLLIHQSCLLQPCPVVLGGLGNVLGSVISATFLTVLPEVLREFADYRMLVYAVVLILVMIFTNNPMIRSLMNRLFGPVKALFRRKQKTVSGGDA